MKTTKLLLGAIAALMATSVSAAPNARFQRSFAPAAIDETTQIKHAPVEDGYEIQFAGKLKTWTTFSGNASGAYNYAVQMTVPAEIATRLAGNVIDAISFSSYIGSNIKKELPGSVYVVDGATGNVISTATTVVGADQNAPAAQVVSLDQAYTIQENTPFTIGYTVEGVKQGDYPVGVDNGPANIFAGEVIISNSEGNVVLDSPLADGTYNAFITAITKGEKQTLEDLLYVVDFSFSNYDLPTYKAGEKPKASFTLYNPGDNKVTSMSYAISYNDETPEYTSGAVSVAKGGMLKRTVNLPALPEGYVNIYFNINNVNGNEWSTKGKAQCIALNESDFVPRKFVVEKLTGTWCGYCPLGIYGFEVMSESHPDEFIAIDIHNGDEMSVDDGDLDSWTDTWSGGGVPSAIINRDYHNGGISPSAAALETKFNAWATGNPGSATINAEVTYNKEANELEVTTKSSFQYNRDDADYSVALIVLEDGIKGRQTNYYSKKSGAPGDWGSKGSTVNWVYTHTLRGSTYYFGAPNSIPSKIVKGQEYTYKNNISLIAELAYVLNTLGQTVYSPHTEEMVEANTAVVALLLDNATGSILNATRVNAANFVGVNTVADDINPNAPVEYYNLQGMRIENPQNGLFIRRQGNNVSKVIIK